MRLRPRSTPASLPQSGATSTGSAASAGGPSTVALANGASSLVGRPAQAVRPRVRGRVRTQWMALGAALVVLAGVVVAWAVGSAGRRVLVVQVAQSVAAGDTIDAADLMLTGVAFEPGVEGLVPAESLDVLIGRIAAIDLGAGVLLQRGMWRDGATLREGERAVGAVLEAGRFPLGIGIGSTVLAASLADPPAAMVGGDQATPADGGATGDALSVLPVSMRVVDVVVLDDGAVSFSFAVPFDRAVVVAQLAATDQLVVVGTLPADRVLPATIDPDGTP